jgi:hypothetical protein
MTAIPTYVPLIPLPAPLTSGTTTQSYTDPNGDVWVAKNGVNGGNWGRARDVLFARVWRSAAYTYSTTATNMPFDTVSRDLYGMWGSPVFTFPVVGVYKLDAQCCVAFTAAGQFIGMNTGRTRSNIYSGGVSNSYSHIHDLAYYNAGDQVAIGVNTSASLTCIAGSGDTYFSIAYMGTG